MIRHCFRLLNLPATLAATVAAAIGLGALVGCQTTTEQIGGFRSATGEKRTVVTGTEAAKGSPKPFTDNFINSLDPCADQMQDLCGALLLYYHMKKGALPARLEDLQQFADVGTELKFTCPLTGKRYVYAPGGLEARGQNIRIYIYDAEPAHVFYNKSSNPWSNPKSYGRPDKSDGGSRLCIFTKPDATTGAPILFADEIPERAFREYAPSATPATAPPAASQPAR